MEEKRSKILIVDDEPGIVDVLKEFLSGKGYDVVGASNGKEALEILKKWDADLILLDIIMPELKGTEVARIVKDRYPNTKVIVLTGYPDKTENLYKDNLLEALFVKPVKLEQLYKKLTEILSRKTTSGMDLSTKEGIKARFIFINAKLLFVVPSKEVFDFLNLEFKQLAGKGQNYELDIVLDEKEIAQKIPLSNPDIVILDKVYSEKIPYNLTEKILMFSRKIKEVISFDLASSTYDYNALQNLVETIRSLCIKNNLIETKEI